MGLNEKALRLHEELNGKIEIKNKLEVSSMEELAMIYSPGVAVPCLEISKDKEKVYDYTIKNNTVLVVSDGSAVLGLGNISAEAALPVMEGKAALFKQLANINAFPICLATQDTEQIIETIKNIAPVAGGINLEDISAPRCFEIEERLKEELDIPIMHDDQHGTAIVCTAGLLNALKVVKKDRNVKVLINGMGAAGVAITKLLIEFGFFDFCLCDINGVVYEGILKRNDIKGLNELILERKLSKSDISLEEAIKGRDVFIGVSAPDVLTEKMVKSMNENPIVFAMANPDPEISFEAAMNANVAVFATGRSDYPNQINNILSFPGIFKGALDVQAKYISEKMKMAAVEALMSITSEEELSAINIVPNCLNPEVVKRVAAYVANAYEKNK